MADVNGVIQLIENGKVVDTTASGNSQSTQSSKASSSLDKEAFLQLLVAQMKYQDPLEPTSNTEYISQLATFSSLEEMQNLNSTMTSMQGMDLVGKQVVMKVTSESTGVTTHVSGYVDYVMKENGKTYLVVEGNPYNIEDLESVVDEAYLDSVTLAETFKEAVANLPDTKNLTLDDETKVEAARDAVNAMTSYQQGFLDSDSLKKLTELLQRLEELKASAETETGTEDDSTTEETDTTGESGDVSE